MALLWEIVSYYVGIGMIVVVIFWFGHKLSLLKEVGEKGIANTKIEPVGLDVYLYVWFAWPRVVYITCRDYFQK
ncbi:MAG: hypothetical protein CO002_04710 [Candidatus Portnoybacteria bacterium CG_4_8_14_3_um_filter_44_10]|uniref:Uncharacterized protein n=5 Tax=Candidatus Portnoyibacteriota TaxID=1817913 RepID=A0A2H0KPQ4_9BACT|nr:MAG: hypothetical protein AUK17_03600 [Parcubacteria group bacterium CG2_30_44_18]PIQ74126.1 MAG: hypothetical protein COV85_03755 [Candidatus Portnoybacteria bacterium CG11_big_fil_rev_8_21_14_0_20_44_10]PIS16636.1 MAG: hypothetical protein COT61_02810 [Candidatus Portnoybacteria bacterium CG09_land_8_20_14_0_10_44_13]PIW74958.1 MAG: hypothetical protein CO002_04710 [Candidatus Portnoybacteria bacterium CG_4_8_14_3_um_filter_44_10]PIZ72600.1 MAG: hypothetical protein COY11_00045 [Candidatus